MTGTPRIALIAGTIPGRTAPGPHRADGARPANIVAGEARRRPPGILKIPGAVAIAAQPYVIGYFAKISPTRLNAFSVAACGVMPPWMMSIQPAINVCSLWTWA